MSVPEMPVAELPHVHIDAVVDGAANALVGLVRLAEIGQDGNSLVESILFREDVLRHDDRNAPAVAAACSPGSESSIAIQASAGRSS